MEAYQTKDGANRNEIMVIAKHPVVVEGLQFILRSMTSQNKIAESYSFVEARASIISAMPNLVIIDTIFGSQEVLGFIQWLNEFDSRIKIMLLFETLDEKFCVDAFKCGAKGYFLKNSPPDKIIRSLHMVQEGRILLDETIINILFSVGNDNRQENIALNKRDIEVLYLVAKGSTNQDISNRIFISSRTVQGRLSKIFSKLGVKTRTEAVTKAIQMGIIKQECRVSI